ncbi:hypothetical protein CGRA01v4_11586 [Colletotrichum graminicola]|nr:hypothetical protein CGRA01v4_11586 [Colletotrichum graminicola]
MAPSCNVSPPPPSSSSSLRLTALPQTPHKPCRLAAASGLHRQLSTDICLSDSNTITVNFWVTLNLRIGSEGIAVTPVTPTRCALPTSPPGRGHSHRALGYVDVRDCTASLWHPSRSYLHIPTVQLQSAQRPPLSKTNQSYGTAHGIRRFFLRPAWTPTSLGANQRSSTACCITPHAYLETEATSVAAGRRGEKLDCDAPRATGIRHRLRQVSKKSFAGKGSENSARESMLAYSQRTFRKTALFRRLKSQATRLPAFAM